MRRTLPLCLLLGATGKLTSPENIIPLSGFIEFTIQSGVTIIVFVASIYITNSKLKNWAQSIPFIELLCDLNHFFLGCSDH